MKTVRNRLKHIALGLNNSLGGTSRRLVRLADYLQLKFLGVIVRLRADVSNYYQNTLEPSLNKISKTFGPVAPSALALLALFFGSSAMAAGPTPGTLVIIPSSNCQSVDSNWYMPSNAAGRKDGANLSRQNSAVWLGGQGSITCGGFKAANQGKKDMAVTLRMGYQKVESAPSAVDLNIDGVDNTTYTAEERGEIVETEQLPQETLEVPQGLKLYIKSANQSWQPLKYFENGFDDQTISVRLPQEIGSNLDNLKFKLEAAGPKQPDQQLFVDSVSLSYVAANLPKLNLDSTRNSDDLPVYGSEEKAKFNLEVDNPQDGYGEGLKNSVGATFGQGRDEPDVKVTLKVLDDEGNKVEVKGAETDFQGMQLNGNQKWDVSFKPPAELDPGQYKAVISYTDEYGNLQKVEQDFLWGVLAINMHKNIYQGGDTVNFDMAVLDEKGEMVCDAALVLEIDGPSGTALSTEEESIQVNDSCKKKEVGLDPDYEAKWKIPDLTFGAENGTYKLKLQAETANGKYEIHDSFQVGDSKVAVIKRNTATRIFPIHEYPVKVQIRPKQDIKGVVTEKVPSSFKVKDIFAGYWDKEGNWSFIDVKPEQITTDDTLAINWHLDMKKDTTYEVGYKYDAPDESPQFYLLGPLAIYQGGKEEIREPRQWQIAIDTTLPTIYVSGNNQSGQGDGDDSSIIVNESATACDSAVCADSIDEDTESATDTDYVTNDQSESTGTQGFQLEDMPSDFMSMDSIDIKVRYQRIATGNDTVTLTAQIVQSDGSTALTNASSTLVSHTGTADGSFATTTAASLTRTGTNNKTVWDGAELELTWTYTRAQARDDQQIYVSATELNGAYTSTTPTTTLGSGTDPATATVAPESGIRDAGGFSFQTNTGTDSVTALTVSLAGSGTPYNGLAQAEIRATNCSGTLHFAAVTSFSGNSVNFSGGTAITATTTQTEYKICLTPLSHSNMPVPNGASYAFNPTTVTAFTSTNAQAGSDSNSNTLTIDNASPAAATSLSGTAGNQKVTLNWTTSSGETTDSVVLRWAASSPSSEVPAEGSSYSVGNTISTATVACVFTGQTSATSLSNIVDGSGGHANCNQTSLTNSQDYSYKVFQKDSNGNYDTGTAFGGNPYTPAVPTITVNGFIYEDEATTALTECDGSTTMISLRMNSVTYGPVACNGTTGAYSFTAVTVPSEGDPMVVWVDEQTPNGTTVNRYAGNNDVTDVIVRKDRLIMMHQDDGPVTNANAGIWDRTDEPDTADIVYTVDVSNNITLEDGVKLIVANGGDEGAVDWYNSSWKSRKLITVDSSKVPSSQTDFPMSVSVTDMDLTTAQTDGDDFVFTDSSGTKLSHEIEEWNDSTGEFVAWVKTDLSGASGTDIYLYYDNSGATNQQDAANVWDSNYRGVWHLEETATDEQTTSALHQDSTTNNKDGDQNGNTDQPAQIYDGQELDGTNDYIEVPSPNLPTTEFTFEAWVKLDNNNDEMLFMSPTAGGFNGMFIHVGNYSGNGHLKMQLSNVDTMTTNSTVGTGTWHHIAFTRNSSNLVEAYIDGVKDSNSAIHSVVLDFGTCPLYIGLDIDTGDCTSSPGNYLDGIVDEARVSDVPRSADWITTEYNNQNDPSSFYSYGTNYYTPGGTVDTSDSSSSASTDGDIEIEQFGVMTMGTNSLDVGGDLTNNGTLSVSATQLTTFTATATGHTITTGNSNLVDVTFDGAGGGWSFSAADTITETLTMSAGTLSGTNDLTVNGDVTGSSTINLTGGTFTQRIAAAQNFGTTSGSNNWTFNNLAFSNSAGTDYTVTANTGGTGSIITSGTLTVGNAGDTNNTTLQNNTNDRVIDVNGSLVVTAKGVLQASSSASFTIADDFTNNGTFTANSGTVTLDTTTEATIAGNGTAFYDFTSTTAGKDLKFTAGHTFTINGLFNISVANISSDTGAAKWFINHQGTESVSVSGTVSWSGCDVGSTDVTVVGTDGGNNDSCWVFVANSNPSAPTSLEQRKDDDTTVIAQSDWTNETTVEFFATVSDPDNHNTKLCIEYKALGTAFDGTGETCGTAVTSGTTATVVATGLTNGEEYHWRARTEDSNSAKSASWVSYPESPTNLESVRDFGIDTTNPVSGSVYDGTSTGIDAAFNDGSLSSLSSNWSGFSDSNSGIDKYEYSLGSSQGGTELKAWTPLENYLELTGTSGEHVIAGADTAATSITGSIDLRADVQPDDWSAASDQALVSKWKAGTSNRSYLIEVKASGLFAFVYSPEGTSSIQANGPTLSSLANGERKQLRATYDSTTGEVNFYTRDPGVNLSDDSGWGTPTTASITSGSIYDGTEPLAIGAAAGGNSSIFDGKIYEAHVENLGGATVANPDFRENDAGVWADSVVTDDFGNVWSIEGAASTYNSPAASLTETGLTLQTSKQYYYNIRVTDNAENTTSVSSDGQSVLPTLSFSVSPTSLTFDQRLNSGNSYMDTEDTTLTTSTNAYAGYVIRAWALDNLFTADDSISIPWHSGSWNSPAVAGAGYGYSSSDSNVNGLGDIFTFSTTPKYAPFTETAPGNIVADTTTTQTGTPIANQAYTIRHRVQADASQAAGVYDTTVIYTVTAEY